MQEALRDVKAALGEEAVILDTAEVAGQVVVTAANDDDPATGVPHDSPAPAADPELMHEVRRLLGVVHELVDERWRGPRPELRPELAVLHRRLAAQGVDGVIAAALVLATAERLEHGAPLDAALARALTGAEPLAPGPRVRVFLGTPGDGKTTTLVKLAAQAVRAGRRVALVTADTYRIGALAELQTFGRALDVPVESVTDAAGLPRALERLAAADLVLVDTAGASPGQEDQLAELARLTAAAGPGAGRTLVASAASGSWAASQTWRAFAPLAPDGCVLTKLDVAPGGPMVGLCWRQGLTVSHLAAGRRIPDDLEPATPERLARCLLAA